MQADGKVSVTESSFGAKTAEYGKTLSNSYLNSARKKGTIDYVSKDLIIDASTCLFPDYTWFVRDIAHDEIPKVIDSLMLKILRSKGQKTVRSFEDYPQFMSYNITTQKVTEVSAPIPTGTVGGFSGLANLMNVFSSLFKVITNLFLVIFAQSVQ